MITGLLIYRVFSYLIMIGFVVMRSIQNEDQRTITPIITWIFSPIVLPIIIGIQLTKQP